MIWIPAGILLVAVTLGLIRFLYGPDVFSRMIALELLSGLVIAVSALAAWTDIGPVALDVGLVLGLVGFLGSVGLSWNERKQREMHLKSKNIGVENE